MKSPIWLHWRAVAHPSALAAALLALQALSQAGNGSLEIRGGYFWDPATGSTFIPRGIAYQTWNPPVGADQTFSQLDYDLQAIRNLPANSVRCEIVWNEVEPQQGIYDWSKPDYMVRRAEELGLKLFVVIGFNYAPGWFPTEWKALDVENERSVVLNYEHPEVRRAYSNYIGQVAGRYRDSTAIGGWILGNEYAYFDLWNEVHNDLGYDSYSLDSFRRFLAERYGGSIASLSTNWGTNYSSFDVVPMPRIYPSDRNSPAYLDLTHWRERSVGDYVAVGALAARAHDPNHLITYSMVGGLFIGFDADYTFEDARTIANRCEAAGAPLDFWSINNYAWASFSGELRSGDFGIAKHRAQSGLPVMISETGHTSTDNLLAGAPERQAQAIPAQMWEALVSGAVGFHIFTWNDREKFGVNSETNFFYRERGFGIVYQNRSPKPAYGPVSAAFRRMEELGVERLLAGSRDPNADVLFFWPEAAVMGWPRANQEQAFLWGPFKRLGYKPGLLDQEQLQRRAFTNAAALLLPRCFQMRPGDLALIRTNVLSRGLHLHATTDLPGEFDEYHRANPAFADTMGELFGLDVTSATLPGWDAGVTNVTPQSDMYNRMNVRGVLALGDLPADLQDYLLTWKIWHGISVLPGRGLTYVTQTGLLNSQPAMPALHTLDHGTAKAALTTFALGDIDSEGDQLERSWNQRRQWLNAIYSNYFGIKPAMQVSGPGSQFVILDYRECSNGTVLLSLLNADTNTATVTLSAPRLIQGRVVENLTGGGTMLVTPDGTVSLSLRGDEYALLYAYDRLNGSDTSLINTNANKLWFTDVPAALWPNGPGTEVEVGFDLVTSVQLKVRLEALHAAGQAYAESTPVTVSSRGTRRVTLPIPEARLEDPHYLSSTEGGRYRLRAVLDQGGRVIADTTLPVELNWGVRPVSLPPASSVLPGSTHPVTLRWENLPSPDVADGGTPLERVAQYQPTLLGQRHYEVVLELRHTGGTVVVQQAVLTHTGTGQHTFNVTVPVGVNGPFEWVAYLRPPERFSPHFEDDFENRGPGNQGWYLLEPWIAYAYPEGGPVVQDAGLDTMGFCCRQSAFLVVTNPPSVGPWSGFGLAYTFPQPWSLPPDRAAWSNLTFSVDFMETNHLPCTIELVISDKCGSGSDNGRIHYLAEYTPAPGTVGWTNIKASLDQFDEDPNFNRFNPNAVRTIAVNIQMKQTGAQYIGRIDNARFEVPEALPITTISESIVESFEDRCLGDAFELTLPWGSYVYPEPAVVRWAVGVTPDQHSEGAQSAFLVATNGSSAANPAGFGFYYDFPAPWALPTSTAEWSQFQLACDFLELQGRAGQLEMQLKSGLNEWIEFTVPFSGPGWKTLSTTLDQFRQPDGVGEFDPSQVRTLVVNVRMLEPNAIYTGFVDNIRFITPSRWRPADLTLGTFHSSASAAHRDTDGDGLSDTVETGTGVYVSETNTGTQAALADTDGDGRTDWEEVVCRTNPNEAGDVLQLDVSLEPSGSATFAWDGRQGVAYTLEADEGSPGGPPGFFPVPGWIGVAPTVDGPIAVTLLAPEGTQGVFYRLRASRP